MSRGGDQPEGVGSPAPSAIQLDMFPQPDGATCGPTCLTAVYRYFGDEIALEDVVGQVSMLASGGTLAPLLGAHALDRGYQARIHTFNLRVFDPTWFRWSSQEMLRRLRLRHALGKSERMRTAIRSYESFLSRGGEIRLSDLTPDLLRRYLKKRVPILTGLSSTYLYQTPREYGPDDDWDDVRGDASGHFVVLCGYDPAQRQVLVADPLESNVMSEDHYYHVPISRLVCAILLGIVTDDADLLVITPRGRALPC